MITQPFLSSRFILRKNKAKGGLAQVRLIYSINSQSSEISAKIKCPIDLWDTATARAKGHSNAAKLINNRLHAFKILKPSIVAFVVRFKVLVHPQIVR